MEIKQLDHTSVLNLLPDRDPESHKGNYGRILLLCGSCGYTGAAALAAMGALRVGAGLVYLGVPESIYQIEAVKLLEPIVLPLCDQNGMLSCDAVSQIAQLTPKMDAILVGPGLGRSAGTSAVVQYILSSFEGPVILDADGINQISAHKDILRGRTSPTILTPHEGEFLRLYKDLRSGRLESAAALATECNCIVVLKGHHTVITDGNVCYVNNTGNPGMAVGGSGDVLAGIITGLVGQGISPLVAASCGVWLHGAAGDICEKEFGQYGMLPSDMLSVLPRLLK